MSVDEAWAGPPLEDGHTVDDLVPHGWAPGGYWHRACRTCAGEFDGEKRAWRCRPCAVKALQAERAKPPAPPLAGPEPTDAQVVAFGDAFYGDLTQWGYSERQRNGLAEDVRRALRAAFAAGASGNPAAVAGTAKA